MKKILTVLILSAMALSFSACNETIKSSEDSKAKSAETAALQAETEAPEETKAEYEVTILSSTMGKEKYGDGDVLIVEYQFLHHKDEAEAFSFAINHTAFQNGVECSNLGVVVDGIDNQLPLNKVQPDTPYALKIGYKLQDTATPVNIQCKKLIDFNDEAPLLEQTINLQ